MVSAGDFRNGVTFEMDGEVYQIIEFQHVKPGKGAAFVRGFSFSCEPFSVNLHPFRFNNMFSVFS